MNNDKAISRLLRFQKDVESGAIVLPTALGPSTLKKNSIKAKSITSTMIDVNDLNSVNSNTGNLNITGNLTMSTNGAILGGKTGYTDTINAGYWLGIHGGAAKFRLGGPTQSILWDGTTLTITGGISATTGTIGGWTIGTTDLTADAGAIGLASSGSIRIWLGNATPSSAPFRVTSAGAVTATSGSIGGWTLDPTGLFLGTGTSTRGLSTGSTAFYAGSATPGSAPFRVTTAGAITSTSGTVGGVSINSSSLSAGGWSLSSAGSLTAPTGTIGGGTMSFTAVTINGTLTLGSGGSIVDADGSTWNQSGITLRSTGSNTDMILFKDSGGTTRGSLWADGTALYMGYGGALGSGFVSLTSSSATIGSYAVGTGTPQITFTSGGVTITPSAGRTSTFLNNINMMLGDTGGTYQFRVDNSSGNLRFGVASNGAVKIFADATNGIATGYSTLGSLTGRWAIYNDSGSLVGYIPVYTTIT